MKFTTAVLAFFTIMVCPALGSPIITDLFVRSADRYVTDISPAPDGAVFTVNAVRLQELRHTTVQGSQVLMEFPLTRHHSVTLTMERFEVFAANASLTLKTAGGPQPLSRPSSVLLRGAVLGEQGSEAILAVYPNAVYGWIRSVSGTYYTGFLSSHDNEVSSGPAICVFNESTASERPGWMCGTSDPAVIQRPHKSRKIENSTQALVSISVELEGDTDYYTDHNNDADDATEYAEAVIAAVNIIYKRDLGAVLKIANWTLWETTDPYTSTSADKLLGQFRQYWVTNNTNRPRTIAHLLSGINDLGGIAYLESLCDTNYGYSVSGVTSKATYPAAGYVWDTDVVAHEIGHNIGSPHTHSCSWQPAIDSCYKSEGGCFTGTTPVQGTIMSYCHLTNKGKTLYFHDRCIELMTEYLANIACMPVADDLVASAGNDAAVCGETTVTLDGSAGGGREPYTVSWSPADLVTNPASLSTTASVTTTTSFILTVMDADSNFAYDTVKVTVNPAVSLSLPEKYPVCKGSAVTVTATVTGGTNPKTYLWVINGVETETNNNTYTFTPNETVNVSVQVFDAKNCTDVASTVVEVNNRPVVTLTGPSDSLCAADLTVLKPRITSGTPPFTFEWRDKDGVMPAVTSDSVIVSPDATATYWVKVTDSKGCEDTASARILVKDIHFSVQPGKLELGALGSCQTISDTWITIVNSGTRSVTLERITAKTIQVTSKDFPVTIEGGSSHLLPLQLTLPLSATISDTLVITENSCLNTVKLPVTGQRGSLSAVQDINADPGIDGVACEGNTESWITVRFENPGGRNTKILKAESRLSGTVTTVIGAPVLIAANGQADVRMRYVAPLPAGTLSDTLSVTYESENCTSTIQVPVTLVGREVQLIRPDTVTIVGIHSGDFWDSLGITFNVDIQNADVPTATITRVNIQGPFTTDLVAGVLLENNTTIPVRVEYDRSYDSDKDTVIVYDGILDVFVDSCSAPYRIYLIGRITWQYSGTSVLEHHQTSTKRITIRSRRLFTDHPDAYASVVDVRGAIVAQGACGSDGLSIENVAPGVYGVMLKLPDGHGISAVVLIR